MKKLIEELNETYNSDGVQWCDREFQQGFKAALAIVRSHNPWIGVEELPPIDEKEPDFSIDVILTDGEYFRVGYYAFRTASWIIHRYFKKPVTHWSYLPEAKNDNPT